MAVNAQMNRMIVAAARRGGGLVERLGDVDTHERRAALNDALAAAERAIKAGDEVGREMAEARIDAVFAEARAAHQEQQQEPEATFSFDGGVRGRRGSRPSPGLYGPQTAAGLFAEAMVQSRVERAERATA